MVCLKSKMKDYSTWLLVILDKSNFAKMTLVKALKALKHSLLVEVIPVWISSVIAPIAEVPFSLDPSLVSFVALAVSWTFSSFILVVL